MQTLEYDFEKIISNYKRLILKTIIQESHNIEETYKNGPILSGGTTNPRFQLSRVFWPNKRVREMRGKQKIFPLIQGPT